MFAATFGTPRCAQHLLDAGADVHVRADQDDSDFTENDGLTALEIVENEIARNGMRPRHRALMLMLQERAAVSR